MVKRLDLVATQCILIVKATSYYTGMVRKYRNFETRKLIEMSD